MYEYSIHSGKLTWNPKRRFGRWFSCSIWWFLDSMSIFRGVHTCMVRWETYMPHAQIIFCVYTCEWMYAMFFTQLTTSINQESRYHYVLEHHAIAPKALRKEIRPDTPTNRKGPPNPFPISTCPSICFKLLLHKKMIYSSIEIWN